MNKKIYFPVLVATVLAVASCGTRKRLDEANQRYLSLEVQYRATQDALSICRDSTLRSSDRIANLGQQVHDLRGQLQSEQTNKDRMVDLLKDLSVVSGAQAESIHKSLENIASKDAYIKNLQSAIARKDSLNMVLVMNLKGAIGNLDDRDINIKIEKGVVYIDISDKMLFHTGRYKVTERAREVLGKVAKVLNNHPHIEFMVEGHTDTVPYRSGVLLDNWDLSVKRATSVIRILQYEYDVPPSRMTAAGRGEYVPVAANDTGAGRALNRRTRIVILPQLDQFFKLLEAPADR